MGIVAELQSTLLLLIILALCGVLESAQNGNLKAVLAIDVRHTEPGLLRKRRLAHPVQLFLPAVARNVTSKE